MPRPAKAKTLTKRDLDLYYSLWVEGKSIEEIAKAFMADPRTSLHAGPVRSRSVAKYKKKLEELSGLFALGCRDRAIIDARKTLAKSGGKRTNHIALTDERREELLKHVSGGIDPQTACSLMHVPYITLTEVWYKEDPLLASQIKHSIELQNAEVQRALFKAAKGCVVQEYSKSETSGDSVGGKTRDGMPVGGCSTTETVTTKHVHGSVAAQKFWLVNNDPDRWTMDGSNPKRNSKGRIIEALEAMAKIGDDELEAMDNE